MKFNCEYEGVQITVTIEKNNKTPHSLIEQFDSEDIDDLKSGQTFFYSIYFDSSRGEESLKHYLPNQLLTSDETELAVELDELMEDEGLFDIILDKWKLVENQDAPPSWYK